MFLCGPWFVAASLRMSASRSVFEFRSVFELCAIVVMHENSQPAGGMFGDVRNYAYGRRHSTVAWFDLNHCRTTVWF